MRTRRLWIGLVVLALLTPLGLCLPQRFRAGGAWGEWAPQEMGKQVGFVPEGMDQSSGRWHAPVPDYAPKGWADRSPLHLGLAYMASAIIGIAVCGLLAWGLGRWLSRKEKARAA